MELQIGQYTLYSTTIACGILSIIVLVFVRLSWRPTFPKHAPRLVSENFPVLGALGFFTARWDFYRHGMSQSKSGNFSFYVGKNPIVGLSGDEGRKLFFESKALGFTEGYAVLFGAQPKVKVTDDNNTDISQTTGGFDVYFHKRITRMLRRDNFAKSLPKLLKDTQSTLQPLITAPVKVMDPFDDIYKIVFQLTMRAVGCDDIAEDPALLRKTLSLYETIDNSTTAATVIFPWLPTPALIKRTVAGARLYMILQGIAQQRRKNNVRGEDALQFLLDQGDSMEKIIAFVIGALYAGLLNSGINAAWTLVSLASNPEWMQIVREEVDFMVAKYRIDPNEKPTDIFSRLTVEQWESEFPNIDLCLKESIRFQLVGTAFRRNIGGKDIPIGDEIIPNGAFVVYALDDIHFDPDVYTDPQKWDPSRYLPDRAEDKKKEYAYVGWGAGRHPCLGMKFAKLEQAIIVAHFVALFDYDLCDLQGNTVPSVTPVNRNGHSAKKPSSPIRLKYTVR